MPTLTDIGTLIISTPETCGNRPRIAGTRIAEAKKSPSVFIFLPCDRAFP